MFRGKLQKSATENLYLLTADVYGDIVILCLRVFEYHKRFCDSREEVEGENQWIFLG